MYLLQYDAGYFAWVNKYLSLLHLDELAYIKKTFVLM